ncbi:MAG: hypothetical protein RhofKO_42840 [Rhodothermales bacterium]
MEKMYDELAAWWPLLSPPNDYIEDAGFFAEQFRAAGLPSAPSLLELGAGGGSLAFHLAPHFAETVLTDLAPGMLAVSEAINPTCQHLIGDMRTLRLGRQFDAVLIYDAIEYMRTEEELRQALTTAHAHCKLDGVALFAPDHTAETFEPSTEHGGIDGADRALRYLEWAYDPDPTDTTYNVEYTYVLRQAGQPVRVEHEPHTFGLFPTATWLRLLAEVGLEANVVRAPYNRDIFVCTKRS